MTTETATQNNTKPVNENRERLRKLSEEARELQEIDFPELSINEILINVFYANEAHKEFNTFGEWKKQGMSIKKGEKGFLIWGKKRELKPEEKAKDEQAENEDKTEFFPICYLFSNAQVEPTARKKDAKN
ncbi:ArdC-like ssDNA-binding domain-containing protein [Flavobacterium sp. RHBU_3]|uniref:ArdC-like ssDNA-binding domain-containing protein n=1 Tax=Flavobacterium sp. RHBU_3 TaxID=3391184 RepID=UPI003984B612